LLVVVVYYTSTLLTVKAKAFRNRIGCVVEVGKMPMCLTGSGLFHLELPAADDFFLMSRHFYHSQSRIDERFGSHPYQDALYIAFVYSNCD
jgi:hypothetical protein